MKMTASLAFAIATLTALTSQAWAQIKAETQEPLKMAQQNNPEADFLTFTLGRVLEKAGYKVEYIKTDYTAHFTALELGDLDISATAWTSTQELIDAAVKSGTVENVGSTGLKIQEGWWYPTYVEKVCPGLPNWEALKAPACVEALSTAEEPGKIQYIGTPADWAPHDEERVEALGLQVNIVPSGTQPAMIAAMQGAIQRKQPVIGFGLSPHWLYSSSEGKFVEFPAYEKACAEDPSWGVNPDKVWDCSLPSGSVDKLVYQDLKTKAPGAYEILKRYKITNEDIAKVTLEVEQQDKEVRDLADEWIANNEAIWSEWLK